jgi:hypothetical protein
MRTRGSSSVFCTSTGSARFIQTQPESRGASRAMTRLEKSPNSGSGSSPVSQRTQYGSACPNLTFSIAGAWRPGSPVTVCSMCQAASSAYSATASPSTGLSQLPARVARQMPSAGASAPSHTDHGGAPSITSAGNWAYRFVPDTRSVHHTPGDGDGSASCQTP